MMTLGDIKVESLKLMFANDSILTNNDIEDLENNPNYTEYLTKMNGSISRAMKRIQDLEKTECKVSMPLVVDNTNGVFSINLKQVSDFHSISSLDLYERGQILRNRPYTLITNSDLIVERNGIYRVVYYPEMPIYKDNAPNSTEIPLRDDIAMLIPYFVKGELMEMEEPSMSANATNYFYQSLEEINTKAVSRQRAIKRI